MVSRFYRLDGDTISPIGDDVIAWAEAGHPRQLRLDHVGPVIVSTTFFGFDLRHHGVAPAGEPRPGPPLLFETQARHHDNADGIGAVITQIRTATRADAISAHTDTIRRLEPDADPGAAPITH